MMKCWARGCVATGRSIDQDPRVDSNAEGKRLSHALDLATRCSTNSSFRNTSGGLFQLQGISELQLHLLRGFWNNDGGSLLIVR